MAGNELVLAGLTKDYRLREALAAIHFVERISTHR